MPPKPTTPAKPAATTSKTVSTPTKSIGTVPKTTPSEAKTVAQGDRTDVKYRTQLDPLLSISKTLFEMLEKVRDPSNPWPELDAFLDEEGLLSNFPHRRFWEIEQTMKLKTTFKNSRIH